MARVGQRVLPCISCITSDVMFPHSGDLLSPCLRRLGHQRVSARALNTDSRRISLTLRSAPHTHTKPHFNPKSAPPPPWGQSKSSRSQSYGGLVLCSSHWLSITLADRGESCLCWGQLPRVRRCLLNYSSTRTRPAHRHTLLSVSPTHLHLSEEDC